MTPFVLAAHSPNPHGEWHALSEHLQRVAEIAREFSTPLGAPDVGYFLGLWHDVGKAHPQFQQYLQGLQARGGDHKGAGAVIASRHLGPAAIAIQGHHGGLPSFETFRAWVAERASAPEVQAALDIARQHVDLQEPGHPVPQPRHLQSKRSAELFLRLMFSALVDADFLDTESHFRPERPEQRRNNYIPMPGSETPLAQLLRRFETHVAARPTPAKTEVNRVRAEVLAACEAAAAQGPGFFRLTVPTGGGKTLSGMSFALRHAVQNDLRQVIVAVPFITITQQTTAVYRSIFERAGSPPTVLEHHSGSTQELDASDYNAASVWKRLAAENWDAPIVVTTTVQLFESLFSSQVSACRKLHRLANSVIFLDEVQSLPVRLLETILDGLKELVTHYGVTVVLSTATQPAFEGVRGFEDSDVREIVPSFKEHFAALKRVDYEWRTDRATGWVEAAAWLRETTQCLAILNTKRDALALLDALADPDALHLSTLLCGAHRSRVVEELRLRLASGSPCRLVSTQVIEAGVDLDFPLVVRALGPLESVIQAAGRCNREGRLVKGKVIVFKPEGGGLPPGAYRTEANETDALLAAGDLDPHDPDHVARYYRRLLGGGGQPGTLATDAAGVQPMRDALDYPEVSQRFRMIDDDTVSVVVLTYPGPGQNAEVLQLLDRVTEQPAAARHLLRQLQPYTVAIRRRDAEKLIGQGLIDQRFEGLVNVWHGRYDAVRGLQVADPELVF